MAVRTGEATDGTNTFMNKVQHYSKPHDQYQVQEPDQSIPEEEVGKSFAADSKPGNFTFVELNDTRMNADENGTNHQSQANLLTDELVLTHDQNSAYRGRTPNKRPLSSLPQDSNVY
jgi:hypothetical protein